MYRRSAGPQEGQIRGAGADQRDRGKCDIKRLRRSIPVDEMNHRAGRARLFPAKAEQIRTAEPDARISIAVGKHQFLVRLPGVESGRGVDAGHARQFVAVEQIAVLGHKMVEVAEILNRSVVPGRLMHIHAPRNQRNHSGGIGGCYMLARFAHKLFRMFIPFPINHRNERLGPACLKRLFHKDKQCLRLVMVRLEFADAKIKGVFRRTFRPRGVVRPRNPPSGTFLDLRPNR